MSWRAVMVDLDGDSTADTALDVTGDDGDDGDDGGGKGVESNVVASGLLLHVGFYWELVRCFLDEGEEYKMWDSTTIRVGLGVIQ